MTHRYFSLKLVSKYWFKPTVYLFIFLLRICMNIHHIFFYMKLPTNDLHDLIWMHISHPFLDTLILHKKYSVLFFFVWEPPSACRKHLFQNHSHWARSPCNRTYGTWNRRIFFTVVCFIIFADRYPSTWVIITILISWIIFNLEQIVRFWWFIFNICWFLFPINPRDHPWSGCRGWHKSYKSNYNHRKFYSHV